MAYRNTGYERSLTLTVTKYVDNKVSGQPVRYDGRLAFAGYAQITAEELGKMPLEDYLQRLEDFVVYVEAQNPGLDIASSTDAASLPRRLNVTDCPIGQ